jgi:hypothetical protein
VTPKGAGSRHRAEDGLREAVADAGLSPLYAIG